MSDVRVERVYPHPPAKVWRALTRPAAVARWLAPGDFRARKGHRFTLHTAPAPGFNGRVQCEVLQVDPPRRLVLSWCGGPVRSTVRFELWPEGRGTRLVLQHEGLDRDGPPVPPLFWDHHLAGMALELVGVGLAPVATVGGGILAGGLALWLVLGLPSPDRHDPPPETPEAFGVAAAPRAERAREDGSADLHAPERGPLLEARTGGRHLTYYEAALPTTMNPLFARTMVDRRTHELVFDRLFHRSAITNEMKSRVVTSWSRRDDGAAIEVVLRDDVRWHDGHPLGPEDVCFTIAAMRNPHTASMEAKAAREALTDCEVVPERHAAWITLARAYPDAREHLAFPILPAHAFASTTVRPDDPFATRPVGTGPMTGSLGRREVRLRAIDNPHHPSAIDEMRLMEGGDPLLQMRTVLHHGVDGLITVAPPLRPDVASSPDVVLKSYDLRAWWFIALNTEVGALRDVRVRRALDHTLDRDALRSLTLGTDPHDLVPSSELVSGPFVPSSPYSNRSVPVPGHDVGIANAWMSEAGATMRGGRWTLDGAPITLRVGMQASLDVEARDLLNQVGNQLLEGGFERTVFKISDDDWTRKAVTGQLAGDFDLLIGKWSFGAAEDVGPLFATRDHRGHGELNLFGYSDPTIDALLARHDAATTDTAAQDAYHELHAALADQLPYLFLWKLDTKSAWSTSVRGNTITPYHYFTEFDSWR